MRGFRRPCGGNDLRWLIAALAFLSVVGCEATGVDASRDDFYPTPVEVAPDMRFTEIGAGWFHSCATAVGGAVYCWGKGETGEIGPTPTETCNVPLLGEVPCTGAPQRIPGAPPLHSLGGSLRHSCGLDAAGTAWCWGQHGFLGDGGTHSGGDAGTAPCTSPSGSGVICRASAAPVSGGRSFIDLHVAITSAGTCAVDTDRNGWCWTMSDPVSMGVGASYVPTALPTALRFERLVVQGIFGCGLVEGEAWCWGSNWDGTLGTGTSSETPSTLPVKAIGGHRFTGLAATLSNACGLRTDGAAVCWGRLPSIEGRQQTFRYGPTPVEAGGPSFVEIRGGGNHLCGISTTGEGWCWGANSWGFLGDGTTREREVPTRVRLPAGVSLRQVAVGGVHSCALTTDGRLFCWGANDLGQVGRPPRNRIR
jgi:alpha-tubulin suppressor-like RCC1 family protein